LSWLRSWLLPLWLLRVRLIDIVLAAKEEVWFSSKVPTTRENRKSAHPVSGRRILNFNPCWASDFESSVDSRHDERVISQLDAKRKRRKRREENARRIPGNRLLL